MVSAHAFRHGHGLPGTGLPGTGLPGSGEQRGGQAGCGGYGLTVPAAVRELAERLGRDDAALPAYIYDLDGLAAHAAGIRAAVGDQVELCYAVKANPDPAVLRAVARHADGLEVSSAGELRHAAAAVPGARLSFGGPGKTNAELAAAIRAGTFRFHVESLHELRLLGAAALAAGRQVDILLRVNLPAADVPADVPAGDGPSLVMGGQPAPFGMDLAVLGHCAAWLTAGSREAGQLRLRGIHAHLASGLAAPDLLSSALRVLEFARPWCAARGVRNPEFNLGGGMAVDYRRPQVMFDWASFGRGLAAAARPGAALRVEPGRAVTAYCGWYVTRVLDVKRSHGRVFAVVAGGTHHLRTPAAKGHDQPFTVLPVAGWPHGWPRPAAAAEPVTIVGQLCTPKDVMARDVRLSRLRAADLVAFGLAGAYAWNISHHSFLMHPAPGFHYVSAG
jgi:diaminopimelate decarboxylase